MFTGNTPFLTSRMLVLCQAVCHALRSHDGHGRHALCTHRAPAISAPHLPTNKKNLGYFSILWQVQEGVPWSEMYKLTSEDVPGEWALEAGVGGPGDEREKEESS